MYYYLAHFPKIDPSKINQIRSVYDPNFPYVDPHIAIIFPLDSSIGESDLINHVTSALDKFKSFDFTISGLTKSWDHYLYLEVENGSDDFIKMHDTLYTGMLEQYWFKAAGFRPHITLGFFADRQAKFDKSDIDEVVFDQTKYLHALHSAEALNLQYTCTCDKLSLVSRADKQSRTVIIKNFELAKS